MIVYGGETVPAEKPIEKISTSCNQRMRNHSLTPNYYDITVQRDMFHFISLLFHIKKNRHMRSPCSLCGCLSVYVPLTVARQRLGKSIPPATNTHATMEKLLDASFSVLFVSYQAKVIY